MVALVPTRLFSSLRVLLSMRLNWTFSLRRLSPFSVSTLPRRLSSVRWSGLGSGLTGSAGGLSCAGERRARMWKRQRKREIIRCFIVRRIATRQQAVEQAFKPNATQFSHIRDSAFVVGRAILPHDFCRQQFQEKLSGIGLSSRQRRPSASVFFGRTQRHARSKAVIAGLKA